MRRVDPIEVDVEGPSFVRGTRILSPRTCRACGRIFQPRTALDRYGNVACRSRGKLLHLYNQGHRSRAVPGARPDHPA